jgi:hypothetical protein
MGAVKPFKRFSLSQSEGQIWQILGRIHKSALVPENTGINGMIWWQA